MQCRRSAVSSNVTQLQYFEVKQFANLARQRDLTSQQQNSSRLGLYFFIFIFDTSKASDKYNDDDEKDEY